MQKKRGTALENRIIYPSSRVISHNRDAKSEDRDPKLGPSKRKRERVVDSRESRKKMKIEEKEETSEAEDEDVIEDEDVEESKSKEEEDTSQREDEDTKEDVKPRHTKKPSTKLMCVSILM